MSPHSYTLGAVIPAFQAAATVLDVARRTRERVQQLVVVDDGSTDGTGELLRDFVSDKECELLRHETNRGKGAALRTGMRFLFGQGCDYVATIDADGQHLPEELPVLEACLLDEPDLVLGIRSHLFAAMSRLRRTSNSLSSRWISRIAGESFSDVQTGFRLYRRNLFQEIGLPEERFEAESAVLVRACRRGYRIVTTPVEMGFVDGRRTSHYRPWLDSLRIARAVLSARMERAVRLDPSER